MSRSKDVAWDTTDRVIQAKRFAVDVAAITGYEPSVEEEAVYWPHRDGLVLTEEDVSQEACIFTESVVDPIEHNDTIK